MSVFVAAVSGPAAHPAAGPAAQPGRAELKQAARQFEAALLRQLLAAARRVDFGDDGPLGNGSGGATATFRQMQDDRTADMVADTGCLGLASIIEAQIARFLPASPPNEG